VVRNALGPTVSTVRQQLSPRERELWFRLAGEKLRKLQAETAPPTRRKLPREVARPATPEEEALILQHQSMSEAEQAAWRADILRKAARLFERSSVPARRATPRPMAFEFERDDF
jgi:hypothetical protein